MFQNSLLRSSLILAFVFGVGSAGCATDDGTYLDELRELAGEPSATDADLTPTGAPATDTPDMGGTDEGTRAGSGGATTSPGGGEETQGQATATPGGGGETTEGEGNVTTGGDTPTPTPTEGVPTEGTPTPTEGTPTPTPTEGPATQTPVPTETQTPGEVVDVDITSSFTFDPDDLTVSPGTTVRWTNNAILEHTVRSGTPQSPTDLFEIFLEASGAQGTFTFDEPGEFPYYSTTSPETATGIVRVEE